MTKKGSSIELFFILKPTPTPILKCYEGALKNTDSLQKQYHPLFRLQANDLIANIN